MELHPQPPNRPPDGSRGHVAGDGGPPRPWMQGLGRHVRREGRQPLYHSVHGDGPRGPVAVAHVFRARDVPLVAAAPELRALLEELAGHIDVALRDAAWVEREAELARRARALCARIRRSEESVAAG